MKNNETEKTILTEKTSGITVLSLVCIAATVLAALLLYLSNVRVPFMMDDLWYSTDLRDGSIYKYQLICRYEMVYNEESTSTHFFYIYLKDNDRRTVELIERLTGITIDELVHYNYDDYGYYEDEYYIEPY